MLLATGETKKAKKGRKRHAVKLLCLSCGQIFGKNIYGKSLSEVWKKLMEKPPLCDKCEVKK